MKILQVSNVTFKENLTLNLTLGTVDIQKDCDLAETIIQSVSTQRLVSLVSLRTSSSSGPTPNLRRNLFIYHQV